MMSNGGEDGVTLNKHGMKREEFIDKMQSEKCLTSYFISLVNFNYT
jgi:hypothetical protein